jgi:ABC-2 type transport system ATP-binding protein
VSIIEVENARKVFRVTRKRPAAGSVEALFSPSFREVVAVDDVSFSVEPGELVGYIGVNGAGKSTTIKMLTGILVPSSGRISVMGRAPWKERRANAAEIGVVFGQRTQLWWDLPFIESLNLIARIYQVAPQRYRQLLDEFRDTLQLEPLLRVPVREMSLGQKMRAELAAALIHEPTVVYLDEPTIGLDLIVKERIHDFISKQNRERGTTVILTTHDLGDIEKLCRRVIIIDAGRLIYDGPLATIEQRFGTHRTIVFDTAGSIAGLQPPPETEIVDVVDDRRVTLRFDRARTTASRVAAAVMTQIEVVDLAVVEPDLASIVRQIYARGRNGEP